MRDRRIRTPRLVLEPVDPPVARRVVDGDLSAVRAGAGWPHGDSLHGLRLAVELGGDAGWFVTLGGLVIGECGTKGGPDPDGAVEIGYGLAAPWRGRGYGRELVAALSAWLLDRHGAARGRRGGARRQPAVPAGTGTCRLRPAAGGAAVRPVRAAATDVGAAAARAGAGTKGPRAPRPIACRMAITSR